MRLWLSAVLVVVGSATQALAAQESRPSFAEFLASIRAEALERGIRQQVIDAALSDIQEPLPVVIERDRSQAETVLSLERYLSRRLTPTLVKSGREALARHRLLLEEVSARYGVPPEIIVGIWGFESNFGGFSGVRPAIAALATLAWDPRRSAFFRSELFAALEILNRGDIDLSHMRGSWAGAMGQLQFMPSSYLKFAEDYDGDGRRDIWSSPPDIFASVGNYLKGNGWIAGEPWGQEVRVSEAAAGSIAATVARRAGSCQAKRDMTIALPIAEWRRMGVRLPDGKGLPEDLPDAALVSGSTRHFLVHHNYDSLLDYNCAHSYAIGVGLLAARVNATDPLPVKDFDAQERQAAGQEAAGSHPPAIGERLTIVTMETDTLDQQGIIVTCPQCGQKNRLIYERLGDAVRCPACKTTLPAPGLPIEVDSSAHFDDLIAHTSLPVVVDFWAPWCGPCRMVAPELQKVAARQAGKVLVVKVNTDQLGDLGQRFGIRSIPTMAVFAGGREVGRTSGARPASDIEAFVEQSTSAIKS